MLLGVLYAVLIVPIWVLQLGGKLANPGPFADPVLWHGHEMVYGFTVAAIDLMFILPIPSGSY